MCFFSISLFSLLRCVTCLRASQPYANVSSQTVQASFSFTEFALLHSEASLSGSGFQLCLSRQLYLSEISDTHAQTHTHTQKHHTVSSLSPPNLDIFSNNSFLCSTLQFVRDLPTSSFLHIKLLVSVAVLRATLLEGCLIFCYIH